MLRGYEGSSMPADAAITAIICVQPLLHDTGKSALNRLAGTFIGALWGFLFLLLVKAFPVLSENRPVLYLLMGLGTLLTLYNAVLIRQQEAAGLAAIVFVCVVITFPDVSDPLEQAFHRILDVLVGIVIALLVNAVRLPRVKLRNRVFFVRQEDLAKDQFLRFSPAVLFRLQSLYHDGARVCLTSEHAPAFHTSQLENVTFPVPLIVMDGAALFDANENAYVSVTHPDAGSCRWLIKRLENMNVSFFVYTVHRDRNCIYHHGPMSEPEQKVYQNLRKSPYRYYLDDDHYSVSDIVYLKVVASKEQTAHIQAELEPMMEKMKLRSVIRPQAGTDGGYSLYFYAIHADISHAEKHLMQLLREKEPDLEKHEIVSPDGYRSERDAIRLLKDVNRAYKPTVFQVWRMKHQARKQSAVS